MMADFVTPRHSAVMERLRRRIELFRQHHNSCESRYENATLERLELERQQTFALHQRCLQAKAKRSNKHRQPQPSGSGAGGEQAGQRAPGANGGGGSGSGEHADNGGTAAEQSRNSTLIALQETVKRKLESASSPLGRDQVNGYSDSFPPNKKACLDNGTTNGSPLDSKLGISDALTSNGTHGPAVEGVDSSVDPRSDFHRKEMKQEPDDILPIVPPSGGGNNSLFPDLNEQEWTELMEELNCSVVYEDIQDIFNDGFADRKDPLELATTPGSGGAEGGATTGGGKLSQSLLPPDLASVKAEFSPASAVFDQDTRTGSPHVMSTSSGPPPPPLPPHPTSSPVASSSASSPVLPPSQSAAPPRQLQPPHNHLLPPGPKDLSPAQQLQQLAAQQQRAQHLHGQMQHKPPQTGAKYHNQGPHSHPPPWPQIANTSQSPLGGAFGMDKPTSPSLYPPEFNRSGQKQLLMQGQPNKGSPKAGTGGYMSGPAGPPSMLGHLTSGPPLSHPPAAAAQAPNAMLTLNNTKPLSHFEAGPGPPRPPNTQIQNKAALLSLIRQQQQIKQKNSMNFRQHIPHTQDQNTYTAPSHGPTNAMTSTPGNNAMTAQPGVNAMASNHGNTAYMNSAAVAAALKQQQQQQILEQQKQQYMQRQQLMAEQEKQRQQDQQLQRHLTRPPPQYQDQPGPPANQNPFPQQVNQFTASSQPMSSVGSIGGPSPTSRMFPQNQGLMGLNMGQGSGAPTPAANQTDMNLASCSSGGGGPGVDVLYNNINMHPNHAAHPTQTSMQRQQLGAMSAPYRQNLITQQQQQHLKAQPNAAMIKQQQLAAAAATRMPGSMQGGMGTSLPGSMPNAAWQQQLANQPPSTNAFNNPPNAFHMQQQTRIAKMSAGSTPFGANPGARPMGGLNTGQPMIHTNMAAAQQRAPPNPQTLAQPIANQQQAQQQQANQNQAVLSDLAAFGQPQGNGRQGLQCNQGYQVSRTAGQQQQVSFGYNVAAGSFAAESDLVDSLLKGQSTQEWMADLDELLASHH